LAQLARFGGIQFGLEVMATLDEVPADELDLVWLDPLARGASCAPAGGHVREGSVIRSVSPVWRSTPAMASRTFAKG
jgi:hypothetical protein